MAKRTVTVKPDVRSSMAASTLLKQNKPTKETQKRLIVGLELVLHLVGKRSCSNKTNITRVGLHLPSNASASRADRASNPISTQSATEASSTGARTAAGAPP